MDIEDRDDRIFARKIKVREAIDARFPNAKFNISCFSRVENIETDILSTDDVIIYTDCYIHDNQIAVYDNFIIHKQPGKQGITYADVIDTLIAAGVTRDDTQYRYLDNIKYLNDSSRNANSVKRYGGIWGS